MRLPVRRSQQLKKRDESEHEYLTAEGIRRLQDTLKYLETDERPKIVEDLSQALKLGDFSENAEYIDAKGRLARIDGRIFSIKDRMRRAVEIEHEAGSSAFVQLGSTVTVEADGKQRTYQIVGPHETNPSRGRISHLSPLGSALLERAAGEIVTVATERGATSYRIISVT